MYMHTFGGRMIRLLIADDHALMREGLKQLFTLAGDITVAGEAENGDEVLAQLPGDKPYDLILLDMSMPGICGDDLIKLIREKDNAVPILVLTMYSTPQVARGALKAGATGYLTKDNSPTVLLGAIRKVANGGVFIDPAMVEHMALEGIAVKNKPPSHYQLSEREFRVLRLLAQGKSLNEIAAELCVSNKTVSTYKARLMHKMGFARNADLVRYAVTHGLVE